MPFPSPSFGLRRSRWKLIAAATAVPLFAAGLIVLQSPAQATLGKPFTPAKANATHTITLVTGDVVTVTTFADGKQTAEVDRPDNAVGGVRLQEVHGDLFILPDEVLPLLTSNKLDRQLFNVTDLIEMGYDDAKTAGVPLIATYTPPKTRTATAPVAPRGSKISRRLSSIGGTALTADKKQARTFWHTVAPTAAGGRGTTLGAGLAKLWLDGRVKVNLKESVPQIGAPEAWAAGYNGAGVKVAVLDTGIDATHPDLVNQIDDKASFVPGEDTADINGHGTHVASTIVGTGAAAGGDYKGVAPGADLIVGKVLGGADGYGADSWVLAGMQWAAESGADIVSMSLGDSMPSDGSDPMSMAVDALSAQYGTLFVIAAGNSGPESTIAAPGAAAAALTVGAVDKQDNLAYFSSTGPLYGSGAMKPDIAAPGVDITAARSQQMSSGEGMYRTISGTSMATPHVSGAAAILAQQHPDWTGQQLKEALMSSAKGLADYYSPYEVGTGRLDVAAAVRSTVRATGSVFFGNFDWPHEPSDTAVTKKVTFTNSGTTAVTLNLAITGTGPFTLGASTVTVPAGDSADVAVTGDPTAPTYGKLVGYLVGTDATTGTAVTRTSVGLIKEEERYDLKIKLIDRDGKPAASYVGMFMAGDPWPFSLYVDGELTLRMPPGTYSIVSYLDVKGERPDSLGTAVLVDPETVLNGSTEVVLDARKARLLETTAPERTEDRQRKVDFNYVDRFGMDVRSAYMIPPMYDDIYVSPTEKVTEGSFALATRWRKGEPMVTLRAFGVLSFDALVQVGSEFPAGADRLATVYAGTGSAAEYAKLKAKGKAVVVTRSDAVTPQERTAAAVAAGAKMLIVVNDGVGGLMEWIGEAAIPVVTVHRDAGKLLVGMAKLGLTLSTTRTPYTSFVYDLTRNYPDQVPDRPLRYNPSQRDLAKIDARYYAVKDVAGSGMRYDMTFIPSLGYHEKEWHPGTRVEWVTPDQVWAESHGQDIYGVVPWEMVSYANTYAKGSTTRHDWFAPAIRPAFNRAFAVHNSRWQDFMTINVQTWSSSSDNMELGGYMGWGMVPTHMQVFQGDTLIHDNPYSSDMQWKEVPSGTLPFRVVLDASRPAEDWRLSTRTHTEWDFISSSNNEEFFVPMTLMQMDYHLETDLRGDVKAGDTQQISLKAGPQAGGSGTGNVTSVTLDVSYDEGVTWQKVTLSKGADGRWNGSFTAAGSAGEFISVRAAATTDSGFGIKQEIIRAYGLR